MSDRRNSALSSAQNYKGAQALIIDGVGVSILKPSQKHRTTSNISIARNFCYPEPMRVQQDRKVFQ